MQGCLVYRTSHWRPGGVNRRVAMDERKRLVVERSTTKERRKAKRVRKRAAERGRQQVH